MTITLPDNLVGVAQTRARENGFASVDAFFAKLVTHGVLDEPLIEFESEIPERVRVKSRGELEQKLLQGLENRDRDVVVTPEYFEQLHARLEREARQS